MKREAIRWRIAVMLFAACATSPAQPPADRAPAGAAKILEDKYHIASTRESLLLALNDPRDEVRVNAALLLGSDMRQDAIPPILAALAAETVPYARVSLAVTAAGLGSEEAADSLKAMCGDPTSAPGLRMLAAHGMVNVLGRNDCLGDTLDLLRLPLAGDPALHLALGNLCNYKRVSARDGEEIRRLAPKFLRNDDILLRIDARQALSCHGDETNLGELRVALATEKDDHLRAELTKTISAIEAKRSGKP